MIINELIDLNKYKTAPELNFNQFQKLSKELDLKIMNSDWLTIGVMAKSDDEAKIALKTIIQKYSFTSFRDFEDYYYVGLTYRFLNDQLGSPLYIAPIAGLKKSNFYFGYSYQVITNEILGYSTGTHVLTVGMDLFQGISNCRCMY